MADPNSTPPTAVPTGVIHDLGYRAYSGPRESDRTIGWSLFALGLEHVWGIGRGGKAKILPFSMLAFMLIPAVVMVGTLALTKTDLLISSPITYLSSTQLLVNVFVAAQAPVLFSRDLRSRAIVLYLARPLSSVGFVAARWGALVAATLLLMLAPLLVLTVGSFFGDGDGTGYLLDTVQAVGLVVLLALLLASIAGVISAFALRRGLATIGIMVAFVLVSGVVNGIQAVSHDNGNDQAGALAALASPWSLVLGLARAFDLADTSQTPPTGALVALSIVWGLVVVAACGWLLLRRFAKAGRG